MIQQRQLVAPFSKSVASPRSYYLCQSEASLHKPEVGEFLGWLVAQAALSDGAG